MNNIQQLTARERERIQKFKLRRERNKMNSRRIGANNQT